MTETIPAEAGWDTAPDLIEGARTLELTPATANLAYWLKAVPGGTLRGHVAGHAPDVEIPPHMLVPGPLRDALTQELAFRSIAEEKATRALAYLVPTAPTIDTMEFYATQLIDEARHSMVFRNHLVALGIPREEVLDRIQDIAGADRAAVLDPLEEYALKVMRDQRDFLGGVLILTIIVEGVLAPAAELSERKWRPLNPAAADIERGAGIDEIRHLTVGAAAAKEYLQAHTEERERAVELIRDGMGMWDVLPAHDMVSRREHLFQQGLEQHADIVGDYEIWPGRRLVDTTPEERQSTAERWTEEMQESRLTYMGLEEALK
ncbi:VlmB-like protein [Streptomyces ficellus]|uniref:VlmB-like protein n=1 Tax=Streptomyces ficellus TaxID=1977088 RepID=A0ABT7ZC29_9ACTN|nr:VlmB-like protein [Streptomyces ficellus]MDN3297064.1 VlmB-like protein [Streptomyces ficellus]